MLFRGKPVAGHDSREIARMGMSRTFQHVKLLPTMSVLENVAIGAHLQGDKGVLSSAWRLDRAEEARILKEAARSRSSAWAWPSIHVRGGRQPRPGPAAHPRDRACAVCADPACCCCDEPAAGLRLKEKEALGELLRKLRAEGMAVLIVEHDMDFVMSLVDRVVVMEFGQKIAEGLPTRSSRTRRCSRPIWAVWNERGERDEKPDARQRRFERGRL